MTSTATKFSGEGEEKSVRYWDCFRQQWRTAFQVEQIGDEVYASLSREEREAVIGHLDDVEVVRP